MTGRGGAEQKLCPAPPANRPDLRDRIADYRYRLDRPTCSRLLLARGSSPRSKDRGPLEPLAGVLPARRLSAVAPGRDAGRGRGGCRSAWSRSTPTCCLRPTARRSRPARSRCAATRSRVGSGTSRGSTSRSQPKKISAWSDKPCASPLAPRSTQTNPAHAPICQPPSPSMDQTYAWSWKPNRSP